MKNGVYYVIGGSRVNPLKRMLRSLISEHRKSNPHVLYLEAAGNTDVNLANGFLGNLRRHHDGVSYDALNLYLRCQSWVDTEKPQAIQAAFDRADVIFIEGGNLDILTHLFQQYGLKDLCRSAFERGASVGGICAGGLILLDEIVYENGRGRVNTMPGMGLVPSVAASCYVDNPIDGFDREEKLRELSPKMEEAIGLCNNQAVTFSSNGTYTVADNPVESATAFFVKPDGEKQAIPNARPVIF